MSSTTFVILSFEGPDPYSHAGGLGTRVTGLSETLATLGFETHLCFIGDPNKPGLEFTHEGKLALHRWCQWISSHHPLGVYDGEEAKLYDWNRSLPSWLEAEIIAPKTAAGGSVVIMAEEWQTANSVQALNRILASTEGRDSVLLLWNANNTFSFHRIDWDALEKAATITTVSRYMRQVMREVDIDARVVPNGIPESWLKPVDRKNSLDLRRLFHDRLVLIKMARWDPDKRWEMAVDAVAELKRLEFKPLFLARGGQERQAYGDQILERAEGRGLRLSYTPGVGASSIDSMAEALQSALDADMVVLQDYVNDEQRKLLFRVANAVLANSGIEPFGLVGLETMASGGVAFIGATGEDYATPGYDAISLQTDDPHEIVRYAAHLHDFRDAPRRLRRAARRSAERYTWPAVIKRVLFPLVEEMGIPLRP
ncbi:MAG: glycosyltransferase [Chloroflexi bacterium]|nr:glycosyltransferase [Chloroflexota bacterium]